ncbi:uncharacterized protein LOC141716793 [Apium graveolens]|uniref:uncharacterized protein LOC141716793 n=1 Tax=Apium graveolens TaxID=4045 RepID=UPI003D7B6904
MKEFNIDCRGLFGSVMIYSYKGNGKFFVNCLKDDLCEVIYFNNRTILRGTFYDQDLVTGKGWKFLVFLNYPAVQVGEIPIPGQFWRAFGKLFQPKVQFYMRNGSRYEGTCSKTEKKMYVLQDLVQDNGLSEIGKVLFTYFGEGNFFVMIFDKSNIEVMLLDEDSSSSEYRIRYGVCSGTCSDSCKFGS